MKKEKERVIDVKQKPKPLLERCCKWCGSTKTYWGLTFFRERHYLYCESCHYRTSPYAKRIDAIREWAAEAEL